MQGARGKKQEGQATDEENVALLVILPAEVLELQRQHRHFRDQEEAEEQHEEEEEDGVELQRNEEGMLSQHKASPEKGIGGSGQSDEAVVLALVEVELGQSQSGECRHQEGRIGQEVLDGGEHLGTVHFVEKMEDDAG